MSIFCMQQKKGFLSKISILWPWNGFKKFDGVEKQVDTPPINVPTNVDDRSPINHSLFYTIGEI